MSNNIRVLIVDDDDQVRAQIARLLEYIDQVEVVGEAENGQQAVEKTKELKPRVVLMDLHMPVMNGIEATKRIKQILPETQIIIISVQDELVHADEAFEHGARHVLRKPMSSRELTLALKSIGNPPPPPPPMLGCVVSVCSLKGGVGKTTIAVNLAVGLAGQFPDQRTIIVDSHIQAGDVGIFLNEKTENSFVDLARTATDVDNIDRRAVLDNLVVCDNHLKFLPAPVQIPDEETISFYQVKNLLTFLKKEFDYIIVDMASAIDDVTSAVFAMSDLYILVTEPTMPAAKDARLMLSQLQHINVETDRIIPVLNRVSKDSSITPEQISGFLSLPLGVVIPYDPMAEKAVSRSTPLITTNIKLAPAVRPLAQLVELVGKKTEFLVR
jgi:pilus assembly protein CpaE